MDSLLTRDTPPNASQLLLPSAPPVYPNTSSTPLSPAPLSTFELWTQLILFYTILAGTLATLGNIAIAIGIFRTKKLRNRFFTFVGFLTINRIVLCIQYGTLGVYRSLRTVGVIDTYLRTSTCFLLHIHLNYGLTLEMVLLLVLVIDRMLAIVVYNYYRNLTSDQAVYLCLGVYAAVFLFKLVPSCFGIDFQHVIICATAYSPVSLLFASYTQNIDLALALLILTIYGLLLAYLKFYKLPLVRKQSTSDVPGGQAAMTALKRQMKLMPLLCRLVLIHCSLALASKLLLSLGGLASLVVYSQRLVAYGGSMITVDLFVNVIMLLASNKDLREAIVPRAVTVMEGVGVSGAGPLITSQNMVHVVGMGEKKR